MNKLLLLLLMRSESGKKGQKMSPSLYEQCVGSLTSHRIYKRKVCETVPAVLSRLSEKTRKFNRLL